MAVTEGIPARDSWRERSALCKSNTLPSTRSLVASITSREYVGIAASPENQGFATCSGNAVGASNASMVLGIDRLPEAREDRRDIVDATRSSRIAQQLEGRQRGRRDLHRARISLTILNARRYRFHVLAEVEHDSFLELRATRGYSSII